MAMGAGVIWPAFRNCPDVVGAPRRVANIGAATPVTPVPGVYESNLMLKVTPPPPAPGGSPAYWRNLHLCRVYGFRWVLGTHPAIGVPVRTRGLLRAAGSNQFVLHPRR
jgi:hypothetical protein